MRHPFDSVRESFFNLEAMKESFFGAEEASGSGQAFLLNIRIFPIGEVLILILALVIAVIRSPGPVFFPFRLDRDRLHGPVPGHAPAPR